MCKACTRIRKKNQSPETKRLKWQRRDARRREKKAPERPRRKLERKLKRDKAREEREQVEKERQIARAKEKQLREEQYRLERASATHKTCTKCGVTKPMDEFHRNKDRLDGHEGRCARCENKTGKRRKKIPDIVPIDGFKVCRDCGQQKPISEFGNNRATDDGKCMYCLVCMRTRGLDWSREHREYGRAYAKSHKEHSRLHSYRLSETEYQKLLDKQGGVCAICANDFGKDAKRLNTNIDHDHITGRVRGILCSKCNTALGLMQDSYEIAVNISNYLKLYGR